MIPDLRNPAQLGVSFSYCKSFLNNAEEHCCYLDSIMVDLVRDDKRHAITKTHNPLFGVFLVSVDNGGLFGNVQSGLVVSQWSSLSCLNRSCEDIITCI